MTNIPAQGATSLRERLIDDMNVRRLCRATQRNCVRDVARFAGWLGRPTDQATERICVAIKSSKARWASARRR
jgi:integrase/recombinase XerD